MTDLILLGAALIIILASPHPVIGLICGVAVYCSVGFRMWAAVESAKYRWNKARHRSQTS